MPSNIFGTAPTIAQTNDVRILFRSSEGDDNYCHTGKEAFAARDSLRTDVNMPIDKEASENGRGICNSSTTVRSNESRRSSAAFVLVAFPYGSRGHRMRQRILTKEEISEQQLVTTKELVEIHQKIRTKQQKTEKQSKAKPARVDVVTWSKRVADLLAVDKKASKAFEKWKEKKGAKEYAAPEFQLSKDSSVHPAVREAYFLTLPRRSTPAEGKQHDNAIKQILALGVQVNATLDSIEKAGGMSIIRKDGFWYYTNQLLDQLKQMKRETDIAQAILDQSFMQEADVISYCIRFIIKVQALGVTEMDAVRLARLLMEAHGVSRHQLDVYLSENAVEESNIRKRKDAYLKNREIVEAHSLYAGKGTLHEYNAAPQGVRKPKRGKSS